jgi:hypothetical protein
MGFVRRSSRRVAPDMVVRPASPWLTPLAAEQLKLQSVVLVRHAARAKASILGRLQAQEAAGAIRDPTDDVPAHLLRRADGTPAMERILDLVLVRVASSSSSASTSTTASSSTAASASTAAVSTADGSSGDVYRVGMQGDEEESADMRRRRVYALNQVLHERQQRAWRAYQRKRRAQMAALELCVAHGSAPMARRALHRLAERCAMAADDEALRAKQAAQRAAEARAREADEIARCVAEASRRADDEEMLKADEDMLNAMPIDEEEGEGEGEGAGGGEGEGGRASRTSAIPFRFCPWHSTADGCPLHCCPLSHRELPAALVTWKYRAWALEAHNGWKGERINSAQHSLGGGVG